MYTCLYLVVVPKWNWGTPVSRGALSADDDARKGKLQLSSHTLSHSDFPPFYPLRRSAKFNFQFHPPFLHYIYLRCWQRLLPSCIVSRQHHPQWLPQRTPAPSLSTCSSAWARTRALRHCCGSLSSASLPPLQSQVDCSLLSVCPSFAYSFDQLMIYY